MGTLLCKIKIRKIQKNVVSLDHRYLTYQNFHASVKMLNFWCEILFWKFSGKKRTMEKIYENQRQNGDFLKQRGKNQKSR